MNLLERPIYQLLKDEPFYANFLLSCRVVINDPKVERAAVGFQQRQIIFFINSNWFESVELLQQISVLKHEILHLLFEHVGIRSGGPINKLAKNYAMDCAINQFLSNLPSDCVTLAYMEALCKRSLNPKDTWEYYYNQLKDQVETQQGNGNSDHDKMEENGGLRWESENQLNKAAIKDIVNKAIKASAGNIPSELASTLSQLNAPAKINWKQQLRNLISSAKSTTTKSNRMKTHRRFDLDQPGKIKTRKLILGVCLDSSGSISDESYADFMNEIHSIAKNTTITYLIHADCEVQKIDMIKGGKPKPGVLSKRFGNGGTMFNPALKKCVDLKSDAIVYFTDGDTADDPFNPGVSLIWVIVGNSPPPSSFGKVLRL